MNGSALGGLKVLDLSRVFAGPSAAQTLADLGASVIKIERPLTGDDTRIYGPHFDGGSEALNRSAYFWAVNRGKKSVAIDLSTPDGAELVRRLAKEADVLIENFKVGTLERYGLNYKSLSEDNPGLIYCSITGFGQTGPDAGNPGYDTIIQAMGGLLSITGEGDDRPGGGPMRVGLPVVDIITALYASTAILAALEHRHVSGKGQFIDIALLDTMVASLSYQGAGYLNTGRMPPRVGMRNHIAHPSGVYNCSDGQVVILAGNDSQFRSLTKTLGVPDLADDVRFSKVLERVKRADLVDELLAGPFSRMTVAECVAALNKANVPVGPINDLESVFESPQVLHRRDVVNVDHPEIGTVKLIASPIRMSATPISYDCPAPCLGEHTRETLAAMLGLSETALRDLTAKGIIQ